MRVLLLAAAFGLFASVFASAPASAGWCIVYEAPPRVEGDCSTHDRDFVVQHCVPVGRTCVVLTCETRIPWYARCDPIVG